MSRNLPIFNRIGWRARVVSRALAVVLGVAGPGVAGETQVWLRGTAESGDIGRELRLAGAGPGWRVRARARSLPGGRGAWESSLRLEGEAGGMWVLGTQGSPGRLSGSGWGAALARRDSFLRAARGTGRSCTGVSWHSGGATAYAWAIGLGHDEGEGPVAAIRAEGRAWEAAVAGGNRPRAALATKLAGSPLPARAEVHWEPGVVVARAAAGGGVDAAGALVTARWERARLEHWSIRGGLRVRSGRWGGSRAEHGIVGARSGALRSSTAAEVRTDIGRWGTRLTVRSTRSSARSRLRLGVRADRRIGRELVTSWTLDRGPPRNRWVPGLAVRWSTGQTRGGVRVSVPEGGRRGEVWIERRRPARPSCRLRIEGRRGGDTRIDLEWYLLHSRSD